MSHIILNNITKTLDGHTVIDNLSYTFEHGKVYGIVGHNGSGKSVLFKLIAGLMLPDNGSIQVEGKPIGVNGSMPEDIGILIEQPGFIPQDSGYENLRFLANIRKRVGKERIDEILEIVGLHHARNKQVKKYSMGMVQRLGIAQALMENPQLLLLDEPFNSLDEEGVIHLREVIKEYIKDTNATLLFTSHNKEDIHLVSDQILKINKGKLVPMELV